SFKRKGDLQILVEGDRRMFNQYSAILVNPAEHPNVKKEFGQASTGWCRQKGKSLSATTRLIANSCSTQTPTIRTRELTARAAIECPLWARSGHSTWMVLPALSQTAQIAWLRV